MTDSQKKYEKAINKNDHQDAVKWLLKIIDADKEHNTIVPKAKVNLGKSYRILKQYKDAMNVLEDVIKVVIISQLIIITHHHHFSAHNNHHHHQYHLSAHHHHHLSTHYHYSSLPSFCSSLPSSSAHIYIGSNQQCGGLLDPRSGVDGSGGVRTSHLQA